MYKSFTEIPRAPFLLSYPSDGYPFFVEQASLYKDILEEAKIDLAFHRPVASLRGKRLQLSCKERDLMKSHFKKWGWLFFLLGSALIHETGYAAMLFNDEFNRAAELGSS